MHLKRLILINIFLFYTILSSPASAYQCHSEPVPQVTAKRAGWLQGNWGIRIVIPGGDAKEVTDFNVNSIVQQVSRLKSPKWVMVNLTMPTWGGYYASPNPVLKTEVDSRMVPSRDLFSEVISALRAEGFRIIVYFAAQGPSTAFLSADRIRSLKNKRSNFFNKTRGIEKNWSKYLYRHQLTPAQGVAGILKSYSTRFGKNIDGWWFDLGRFGDPKLFAAAARSGNPDAAIAWNEQHNRSSFNSGSGYSRGSVWMLTRSNPEEDFTDGHVTATRKHTPWWQGNELVIRQIEKCSTINGAIPHFFVPLQNTWRAGKDYFPLDQSISWTQRTLKANGAITWAVALSPPEFKKAALSTPQYDNLLKIDQAIIMSFPNSLRVKHND